MMDEWLREQEKPKVQPKDPIKIADQVSETAVENVRQGIRDEAVKREQLEDAQWAARINQQYTIQGNLSGLWQDWT